MPEFCLNESARTAHPFYALSDFAKGYVEAMFFTNGDTGDERDNWHVYTQERGEGLPHVH